MKANEVMREVLQDHGFKHLAGELGLNVKTLYKWCAPDGGKGGGALNPYWRLAQLIRLTKDVRLLEALCEEAGGRFVPQAEMPSRVRQWWSKLMAEFEQMIKPAEGREPGPAANSRCPHRRRDGRCGYPARKV